MRIHLVTVTTIKLISLLVFQSRLFVNGFTMTFLAEWGDRSQLATIVLAGLNDVAGVCLGGVVGHCICTGGAVVAGALVAKKISAKTLTFIGALVSDLHTKIQEKTQFPVNNISRFRSSWALLCRPSSSARGTGNRRSRSQSTLKKPFECEIECAAPVKAFFFAWRNEAGARKKNPNPMSWSKNEML